jgi:hypothetical protein
MALVNEVGGRLKQQIRSPSTALWLTGPEADAFVSSIAVEAAEPRGKGYAAEGR